MAGAAIVKMHYPKISVDDKLSSQDGAKAYTLHAHAHKTTIGAHNTNDAVEARLQTSDASITSIIASEASLQSLPRASRRCCACTTSTRWISRRTARASKKNGKVERRTVGYFYSLPTLEQLADVLAAMEMRAAVRAEARADLAEQHDYFKHKRAQATERHQAKLIA
eukprot:6123193-Pleurochrysis_carterae.AAC.1